jgi:hypothetical protein
MGATLNRRIVLFAILYRLQTSSKNPEPSTPMVSTMLTTCAAMVPLPPAPNRPLNRKENQREAVTNISRPVSPPDAMSFEFVRGRRASVPEFLSGQLNEHVLKSRPLQMNILEFQTI